MDSTANSETQNGLPHHDLAVRLHAGAAQVIDLKPDTSDDLLLGHAGSTEEPVTGCPAALCWSRPFLLLLTTKDLLASFRTFNYSQHWCRLSHVNTNR